MAALRTASLHRQTAGHKMMALTTASLYSHTAGHKMMALTTASLHRQTAGHKMAALTTTSLYRQTAGHKIAALTTCLRLFQPSNFNKQDEKSSKKLFFCVPFLYSILVDRGRVAMDRFRFKPLTQH